jgi:hypothetical protein
MMEYKFRIPFLSVARILLLCIILSLGKACPVLNYFGEVWRGAWEGGGGHGTP